MSSKEHERQEASRKENRDDDGVCVCVCVGALADAPIWSHLHGYIATHTLYLCTSGKYFLAHG